MWSQSLKVIDSFRDCFAKQPYNYPPFGFVANTDVQICLARYQSIGISANIYEKRVNATYN